jgi:transcriptional regulator with XRE-family HTH domain
MNKKKDPSDQLRKRLREVREYLNLSQQFVADHTGLSRSAIADIERGARRVDSLELARLSQLYRYPVSYFLGEPESELGEGADILKALARATKDLTKSDRDEVLRFARFLRFYGRSGKGRAEPQ